MLCDFEIENFSRGFLKHLTMMMTGKTEEVGLIYGNFDFESGRRKRVGWFYGGWRHSLKILSAFHQYSRMSARYFRSMT